MGGRGRSRGGTGTYLGPWGSRKSWLAWGSIIPLRREQGRLQPSDVDTLARSSDGQLATPFCTPQHTCPLLAPALGSSSLFSSLALPCPQQPRASPAGMCRRKGWAGEGEGIHPSLNNYAVGTLCVPGRRRACSVGQRRPRAKKYSDKCTAAGQKVKCQDEKNIRGWQDGSMERDLGRACFSRWPGTVSEGRGQLC